MTLIPGRATAWLTAACKSTFATPVPLACWRTYMPMSSAECLVLGFAEYSSATVPMSALPSVAPKATHKPSGCAMRLTHQDNALCAAHRHVRSPASQGHWCSKGAPTSCRQPRREASWNQCHHADCYSGQRARIAPLWASWVCCLGHRTYVHPHARWLQRQSSYVAACCRWRICGLTPRSSGAPTAGHLGPARGTRYIFPVRAKASCRCRPVTSNVRRQQAPSRLHSRDA